MTGERRGEDFYAGVCYRVGVGFMRLFPYKLFDRRGLQNAGKKKGNVVIRHLTYFMFA